MAQERLERCSGGCCFFVNGRAVTKQDYEKAIAAHPGNYPGLGSGQRNAILETIIGCRSPIRSVNYKNQINRIVRLVQQLSPSAVVNFDPGNAPNFIRFRIATGDTELTKAWPDLPVGDVAGWNDEKVEDVIESITGGLVRRAS